MRRPHIVRSDELIERVWSGHATKPARIAQSVAKARKAVGDDARAPTLIRTVYGVGYQFVGNPSPGAARRPRNLRSRHVTHEDPIAEDPVHQASVAAAARQSFSVISASPLVVLTVNVDGAEAGNSITFTYTVGRHSRPLRM